MVLFIPKKVIHAGTLAAALILLAAAVPRPAPQVPAAAPDAPPRPQTMLVLDAGHGGEDGGAVSGGGVAESGINLQITRRLYEILRFLGHPAVMTRTGDDAIYDDSASTLREKKVSDLKNRTALANGTPNGMLISIHQNCYPDRKPSGAQVLYAASDGSDALGTQMHDNLVAYLDPQNRRVAAPISDKIYLMREVKCPAVLVECGFLSNESECAKLKDGGYQTKLAAVIIASYLQYRQSLPQTGMVT